MAAAIANITKQGNIGAVREFWVKITEADGTPLVNQTSATTLTYYVENPFKMPVVITECLVNIITLDAGDGDIDIGLSDDAIGTGIGQEFIDSLVNSAVAVKRGLVVLDGVGISAPIWREAGYATDSFVTVYQNSADATPLLEFTILLKCIPLRDMV